MSGITSNVPFSVKGKTALITGAGSGINLSFARLLLDNQCNVVIADLGLRPEAQKLVDAHSSGTPRAVFVKCDVVKWDDLTNMFDVADKEFGGADIVCPGAGVFEPHWSNFWHPPSSSPSSKDPLRGTASEGLGHYATLDINITHPIRTTQLAIARWLNPTEKKDKVSPANPKRIVHISSIAGQCPGFTTPLYIASKHAVSGFIRSLGNLDTIGIRVNGVAPGIIRTPLWTDHPEKLQMIDESVDDWVEPEEVATAMLRCCEDDSITGGYVMEVLKGRTRKVDWRMDPGPSGPGGSAGNSAATVAEAFGWLGEEGWGVVKK